MNLDLKSPMNVRVLETLRAGGRSVFPIMAAKGACEEYWEAGSHPEIVERVWEELGGGLRGKCRCLLFGTPGLVCQRTGIVLALCWGTSYLMRLPERRLAAGMGLGMRRVMTWTGGGATDAWEVFGPDWLFGAWLKEEKGWVVEVVGEIGER